MIVYHEIIPSALHAALSEGLKCTSRGAKGDDSAIVKADSFLDDRCPQNIKNQGVGRNTTIYAYLPVDSGIVDITDGNIQDTRTFARNSSQITLCLNVDPSRCFVSDLDRYDAVKQGIEDSYSPSDLNALARRYWDSLVPLAAFRPGSITRPEIMIPHDISPRDITVAG